MPLPIDYVGTQDDDQTRSIDFVHIEPSIREGTFLVSSLYGRDASLPLYRFPPVNTFAPYITGSQQIPGTLVANYGQWAASPSAQFAVQWMKDGVDVLGATNPTYVTSEPDDGGVFTFELRGFNIIGESYAMSSNSIGVSLIEPIIIQEQENYVLQGISAGAKAITLIEERDMILTGLPADNRLDVNGGTAYFLTGLAADLRQDINAKSVGIIQGLNQSDTMTLLEGPQVAVVTRTIGDPLVDGIRQPLPLKNPGAEFGMLAWNSFGAAFATNTSPYSQAGNYWWTGGDGVHAGGLNVPYSYFEQDVPMYPVHYTDIDAGLAYVEVDFFQRSEAGFDQGGIKLEFYSEIMVLLGVNSGSGIMAPPSGIWFLREFEVAIPPNTRFIRIIPEFLLVSGNDLNTSIDTIAPFIRKGVKPVPHDSGPDFKQWRVRFIQANTWSGTAVSEIAFRNSEGGLTITNGGQVIFGSAGLGKLNADAAFDGVANTDYWAGEENAVAVDTAWLGYDFAVPERPVEMAITARPGSDAYMVGKSFYIEGSDDDGFNWTKVKYVPESLNPLYNTGETRAFGMPTGIITGARDYYTGTGYTYNRSIDTADNYAGKGMIYQAWSRFTITHLDAYINNQAAGTFNYELQLYQCSTQKNGSGSALGMVTEHLESISAVSLLQDGDTWVSLPLVGAHHFEVGDYFLVRFVDLDAATNPDDANEGRIFYHTNWNDEPQDLFTNRKNIATKLYNWLGGATTLGLGDVNPTGFQTNYTWGIDFQVLMY